MSITLTETGIDEVQQKLRQTSEDIHDVLVQGTNTGGYQTYVAIASYAAERTGSTYVRTFEYQNEVTPTLTDAGSEIDYEVTQPDVGMWLHGTADGSYRGAWMHINRWPALVDIIRTGTDMLVSTVQSAIDNFIARIWGNS